VTPKMMSASDFLTPWLSIEIFRIAITVQKLLRVVDSAGNVAIKSVTWWFRQFWTFLIKFGRMTPLRAFMIRETRRSANRS
jgi:hypothetical protein